MSLWQVLDVPAAGPPAVLRRAAVPAGTWTGLTRDRAYRPVGWGLAVRTDLPTTALLRVEAFAGRVPTRATIGRAAAAWVHVGGQAPPRLDLLVPPGGRRVDPRPDLQSHEALLGRGDVVLLAGQRVTSVQRTGLDIARHLPTAQAADWLQALLAAGFDAGAARRRLDGLGRERGVRQANVLLAGLTPA